MEDPLITFDQATRHGRAATHHQAEATHVGVGSIVQQIVENRRHRTSQRRTRVVNDASNRSRLQKLLREDEIRANHPRGVRTAPRIGMEHRNDYQHAIALADCDIRSGGHHQCVQVTTAMAVHHTLRVAGGATRVTHRRARVLRDLGVVVPRRFGGEQLVIVVHFIVESVGAEA